jgi:hypothetical protein
MPSIIQGLPVIAEYSIGIRIRLRDWIGRRLPGLLPKIRIAIIRARAGLLHGFASPLIGI